MSEEKQSDLKPLKTDEFIDDLFGLNIRGLKTIATVIMAPKRYFDAALEPHWGGRYTPSIRLWFSLMAIWALLQFLWLGPESPFVLVWAEGLIEQGAPLPEGMSAIDMAQRTASWFFGSIIIAQGLGVLLFASLYRVWGREVGLALRQRLVFAVTIPGSCIMVLSQYPLTKIPPEHISAAGISLLLVLGVVDFITGYRGAFAHLSGIGRLWRAGLLAAMLLALNYSINFLMQAGSFILAYMTSFSAPS